MVSASEQIPIPGAGGSASPGTTASLIAAGEENSVRERRPFLRGAIATTIFLSLVFVLYAWAWKDAPYDNPDAPGYQRIAQDLKRGHLTQLHLRTPGLALVLLMTGSEQTPTRSYYFVSLAMHLISVAILAALLRYFGVSAAWTALFVFLATLPPFVESAAYIGSETFSEFLVVVTFGSLAGWLITKRTSLMVIFALASTLSAFTRPTFQVLTAILWGCVIICYYLGYLREISRRRLLVSAGATLLFFFGAQVAYAIFNYEKFGYLGMSSLPPYSLSTKVVGVLEFVPDRDADVRDILIRSRDRLMTHPDYGHTGQDYIFVAMSDLVSYYGGDRMRALKKVQELSLALIKAKPMSYLNECVKAMGTYWMPTDDSVGAAGSNARRALWALLQLTIIGLFFLQSIALLGHAVYSLPSYLGTKSLESGAHGANGPDRRLLICLYVAGSGVIWFTMVVSCFLAIGLPRYRIPTDLLIMAVTAFGFQIWRWDVFQQRRSIPECKV